jgi:hypothetical protein
VAFESDAELSLPHLRESAAGAGQARQDRSRPPAARVADEQGVLPIEHHALHFPLAHVIIDGHRSIRAEYVQLRVEEVCGGIAVARQN